MPCFMRRLKSQNEEGQRPQHTLRTVQYFSSENLRLRHQFVYYLCHNQSITAKKLSENQTKQHSYSQYTHYTYIYIYTYYDGTCDLWNIYYHLRDIRNCNVNDFDLTARIGEG